MLLASHIGRGLYDLYIMRWVARVWLKTRRRSGAGGARQGAKISETDAQILEIGPRSVLLKKTSRDPVGTQSGRSRAPTLHFWAPLLGSRDPVGIQSGTNFRVFGTVFGPVGKQLKSPKNVPKPSKNAVLWIWLPPDIGAQLDPDWIPPGSRLAKSGTQKCKIGAQLRFDWFQLHPWIGKNPPRPTLAPI